ncbi:MAG: ATP-binding protein [Thermoplasmatota archaeon]
MPVKKVVGRGTELTFLQRLLDEAIQGKGRVVFLSGEAGVGKTRLVEELASHAQDMGVLYMRGRCLYKEGADPYLPFLEALRSLSGAGLAGGRDRPDLPLSIATGIGLMEKESGPMGVSVMESPAGDWIEEEGQEGVDITTFAGTPRTLSRRGMDERPPASAAGPHPPGAPSRLPVESGGLLEDGSKVRDRTTFSRPRPGNSRSSPEAPPALEGGGITEQLRRIDLGKERDRMFEAISSMIFSVARARPLILFLDDLHWADSATLQLFAYVATGIRSSRVLVIAAYRPEELNTDDGGPHPLTEVMTRIGREGISSPLALRPLDHRETRHLLSVLLARPDFPEGFVEAIFKRTEGNPHFVEEVVKSLVDGGVIDPRDAEWPRKVDLSSISMPSSVRTVIAQRVSRLSGPAAQLLEGASVLGDEFTREELSALSDIGPSELARALDELKDAHLITATAEGERESYRFTRTLLREVVYEGLSRARRRTLHRRAAAAIEDIYASSLDKHIFSLAYHYSGAGDLPRGAKYFAEAGHRALQSYAPDEAARYYTYALEALEKLDPTPENIRLEEEALVSLGNVHYIVGEWDRALEEFGEVVKLSVESGSEACRALSHLRMGEIEEKRSDWTRAAENLQRSLEIYTAIKNPSGIANAHLALGAMHWRQGEYQRALEEATLCLSLLEGAGEKYLSAMAMSLLGSIHTDMGEPQKARECYERGLELAQRAEDPLEISRAYNNLGLAEMKEGHYDAALELLQRSVEAARRSGNARQVGYALASLGECFARAGDLEAAMDHLDSSIAIFEKLDERAMIGSIMMRRGLIFRNAEDWEMARKCFLESTRIVEELNMPFALGEHLLEFGITCALQGDRREARRLITRALHTFEVIGAASHAERARAELRRLEDSERDE